MAESTSNMVAAAAAVLARAREALTGWATVPVRRRAERLGRLRRRIVCERDDVVRRICADSGKTRAEALLSGLVPTLEMLRYLERQAPDILAPRRVPTPMIYRRSVSRVLYRPHGVVLIIAPWNNPFQLALVPVVSALMAGNAVILKPSEKAPQTAAAIARLCQESELGEPALQVIEGGPEWGQALIDQRPDMVFFTGSGRNGRKVLASAAAHMTPVILELGGKDPMLVFEDADLERAANAALYGAFAHAGQHCVSTKRLYVQSAVYEHFLEDLVEKTRAAAQTGDCGRVRQGPALQDACRQVHEALEGGARLLFPGDVNEAGLGPTLIADASPSMRIMREETFAPVLPVTRFESQDEAVRLANDCAYGLNASIWSRDPSRYDRCARSLETGNVFVNNVLTNIGNPHLPFGGVKESGLGRYHGREGLLAFCRPLSVMTSRSTEPSELNWLPHDARRTAALEELLELRYGDISWPRRVYRWLRLLPQLRER